MVTLPGKLLSSSGRHLAIVTNRNRHKSLVSYILDLVSSKYDYGQLKAMIVVNSSHSCGWFADSKGLEASLANLVQVRQC